MENLLTIVMKLPIVNLKNIFGAGNCAENIRSQLFWSSNIEQLLRRLRLSVGRVLSLFLFISPYFLTSFDFRYKLHIILLLTAL